MTETLYISTLLRIFSCSFGHVQWLNCTSQWTVQWNDLILFVRVSFQANRLAFHKLCWQNNLKNIAICWWTAIMRNKSANVLEVILATRKSRFSADFLANAFLQLFQNRFSNGSIFPFSHHQWSKLHVFNQKLFCKLRKQLLKTQDFYQFFF